MSGPTRCCGEGSHLVSLRSCAPLSSAYQGYGQTKSLLGHSLRCLWTQEGLGESRWGEVGDEGVVVDNSIRVATGTVDLTSGRWTEVLLPFQVLPGRLVVVATPISVAANPVMVRVRTTGRSDRFEAQALELNGSGNTTPRAPVMASWIAAESGTYNTDGVRFEARRVLSPAAAGFDDWDRGIQQLTPSQTYRQPVVLGQVMSANGPWSVFCAMGSPRTSPPSSTQIRIGRHRGASASSGAAPAEDLGVMIFESGSFTLNRVAFDAGVTTAVVPSGRGTASTAIDTRVTPINAVVASRGINNRFGSWPRLTGADVAEPFGPGAFSVHIDAAAGDAAEKISYVAVDARNDVARLLAQGAWGAPPAELVQVARAGTATWIDAQLSEPTSRMLPLVAAMAATEGAPTLDVDLRADRLIGNASEEAAITSVLERLRSHGLMTRLDWTGAEKAIIRRLFPFYVDWTEGRGPNPWNIAAPFVRNAVHGRDQLRQRVAWALSQIFVVSPIASDIAVGSSLAEFYDVLADHALGDFRSLLSKVTYHPAMAVYLTYLANARAVDGDNRHPDENYAREVMQLFTIGLWMLNSDGTRQLDQSGSPIPSYDNSDVAELARIFTGLQFRRSQYPAFGLPRQAEIHELVRPDNPVPLEMWEEFHDQAPTKTFIGATTSYTPPTVLPGTSTSIDNPTASTPGGLGEIEQALDILFAHQNVGPFIGRQLILALVTSNPSPAYVGRVAAAFADNGNGVRGDLGATVRQVLLDPEARGEFPDDPDYGKLQEPMVQQLQLIRRFDVGADTSPDVLDSNGELNNAGLFVWRTAEHNGVHGQWPMQSPSVFSFFSPDYRPPGILGGDEGQDALVAPEFQILDPVTVARTPNAWREQFAGGLMWETPAAAERRLHPLADLTYRFETEQNLAGDAQALIDHLDTLMTFGRLSAATRRVIEGALDEIPATTPEDLRSRVEVAVWLVAVSPDAVVLT